MSFQQSNIRWLGSQQVHRLTSPLKTVASWRGPKVQNVIIALHGFGDNAENFSSLAAEIPVQNVLWLFPQGPRSTPEVYGAQWFPLFNDPKEQRNFSENSIFELQGNVRETLGLEPNKIFFLGFSQGASMAMYCGLRSGERFAGIIGLSGFFIQPHIIKNNLSEASLEVPFLLTHGLMDQVLLPAMHYESVDIIKDLKIKKLRTKTYNMGHTISSEELKDITQFIEEFR